MPSEEELESLACHAKKVKLKHFNKHAVLPYGIHIEHVCSALNEFVDYLSVLSHHLNSKNYSRLESILMPANFSSMVGEYFSDSLQKYSRSVIRNQYHNGHPDIIPKGWYDDDAVQYATEGIEVKASRYAKSWQGHNAEETWLLIIYFDSNRPTDAKSGIPPKPFEYQAVYAAKLEKSDWTFTGRSETSRRTITAAVNKTGYDKLKENWLYMRPSNDDFDFYEL